MASSFYERPILNSPYEPPSLYHLLDDTGQPLEGAPITGRRPSKFIVPVPASRKKAAGAQASFDLGTYTETAYTSRVGARLLTLATGASRRRRNGCWNIGVVRERLGLAPARSSAKLKPSRRWSG